MAGVIGGIRSLGAILLSREFVVDPLVPIGILPAEKPDERLPGLLSGYLIRNLGFT
jgi:hypothetical protein